MSTGRAQPFLNLGTKRGCGQHHAPAAFTPGKDPIPIVQEAGWAPEPVWIGAENLAPPGFDLRTFQSVARRYIDYATRLRFSCKVPVILVRFKWKSNFLGRFLQNLPITNFMKIRPVEAEFFLCGAPKDGPTDTTQVIAVFRNFANASKTCA